MKPSAAMAVAVPWVGLAALVAWAMGGTVGFLAGVGVALVGLIVIVATMKQPPPEAPAEPQISPLEQARIQRREVLDDYAAWEFDPEMLLRFPGLWDRSRPEVHRFFDALAATTRAEPEFEGTPAQVETYVDSVHELRMAWAGAERYARSTGTSNLSATHRAEAETGLKLYRHAQGAATEDERQTYYRRALETVRSLVQAGLLPASLPAVARLERVQRGELPSA